MKSRSEVRPVKQAVETRLLKKPGVTGVDIGYKYVAGKKTDKLAIRVFVKEKKDVPKKDRVPKIIRGVRTDVIQRKFVLQPLGIQVADIKPKSDTGTYTPLEGGISIGPCRAIWCDPPDVETSGWYVFTGTLGAIVEDNDSGNQMLLSNFHVMCINDGWNVGDTMAQPSRVDGGSCPADVVGTLQRASLGEQVDCAVASHTARTFASEIVGIGEVAGIALATEDIAVRKRGRTTGLTYGVIDTTDLTVNIDYGDGLGEVTLTNQIGIDVDSEQSTQFGDHGDSGSVVVNNNRKVVGLHFAGSSDGTYGVANPILAVLNALNVSIVEAAAYIANQNPGSMEVHRSDCIWVTKMNNSNKVARDSLWEVAEFIRDRGYNGCFYCLPRYDRDTLTSQQVLANLEEDLPPISDYSGAECTWNNSLLNLSRDGNRTVIETGTQHGGDGGVHIPSEYWGRITKVTFQFEILQGTAWVGVDRYGDQLVASGEHLEAPHHGIASVFAIPPSNSEAIAVIRLEPNSRVAIDWARLERVPV